jgi:hypothetical protein
VVVRLVDAEAGESGDGELVDTVRRAVRDQSLC